MDWGTAGQWAGVAAAIIIAVWGAMSRRNDKAIDELKLDRNTLFQRVDGVERAVAVIQADIEHLPTREEMHGLELKIVTVDGKLDAVLDKIGTLIAQNQRAEERVIDAERAAAAAEKKART